jgi:hypothetical protein
MPATFAPARFKVVAITDERTTCECCGRTNLRRTVGLRPVDGGEVVFYGTTCAAYAMLGRKLDRTRADNYISEQMRERVNWRLEADRISKSLAERGASCRAEVNHEYNVRNASVWGLQPFVTPAVVWSNGTRWFGWCPAHEAFEERLQELGWRKVP